MTRIFLRAAEARRKSKMISRLYNSTLIIQASKKSVDVVNGEIRNPASGPNANTKPPAFELSHYDRLSILLSALNNKSATLIN